MRKLKYFFTIILLIGCSLFLNAQDESKESSVGQFMRSTQRSYVVIAVLLTIFIGITLYLVRLDKKISKLEKD
jgi:fucose permease